MKKLSLSELGQMNAFNLEQEQMSQIFGGNKKPPVQTLPTATFNGSTGTVSNDGSDPEDDI